MDLPSVGSIIEKSSDDHIERIRRLIRQPSVSAEGRGIREMAALVGSEMEAAGCSSTEVVETKGHPIVFGRLDAGARNTLLIYMMYDTQPVEGEVWSSPPFEAALVERAPWGRIVVGRGAINTKGPMGAFFSMLHAVREAGERPPVNLLIVAEGEEELGSPHLPDFVRARADELRAADAVFYPGAAQDVKGHVKLFLGNKGIVYLELEASGASWGRGPLEFDIHSANKAWIDSPAWRLVHALASMTGTDGNTIRVEGLDAGLQPPSEDDAQLVADLATTFDPDVIRQQNRVERFIDDLEGEALLRRFLFSTTLNIDGIFGGYMGEGTKTVLPHRATAKMDIRLVPEQTPEGVVRALRAHLERHGFSDIAVRIHDAYPWSKTSLGSPIAQAVLDAYRAAGVPHEIWPHAGGSLPMYLFTGPPLSKAAVSGGLGHGARAHAPDEYMVLDGGGGVAGLVGQELSYLSVLANFAARAGK